MSLSLETLSLENSGGLSIPEIENFDGK